MDKEGLAQELELLLRGHLKALELVLVELIFRREGSNLVLRILADKPAGGITMDECASLNRQISSLLDENDIIKERYILEVSSPGLDRPLKCGDDFLRFLNKKARVFLSVPVNGKLEWEGLIQTADDEKVCITAGGDSIAIPLSQINKAKLVI